MKLIASVLQDDAASNAPVCRVAAALALVGTILLSGCMTSKAAKQDNTASTIKYSLPVTAMQVSMNLTLVECDVAPKAEAELNLVPVAIQGDKDYEQFELDGRYLQSFRNKQSLEIKLYPHRAIKTVNSEIEDRSAAIVLNLLKVATTMAGVRATVKGADAGLAVGTCKKAARDHLERVDEIRTKLASLRGRLDKAPPVDIEAIQTQIDSLTAEIARINSGPLSMTVKRLLTLGNAEHQGGELDLWPDLSKWIVLRSSQEPATNSTQEAAAGSEGESTAGAKQKPATFSVKWSVRPGGEGFKAPIEELACPGKDACRSTLAFRHPVDAIFSVTSVNGDIGPVDEAKVLAKLTFPMAQWGELTYIPLSSRFGESRALSVELDEFGRRMSFGWKSGARGEEITGGAQEIGAAAIAAVGARDAAELASNRAELDALKIQQELNKLKVCKAVIEAGGYDCPQTE